MQQVAFFDRDNPKVKDTDPLSRMGNVFPLICPQKDTGNRFSVPSFSVFDRDNPSDKDKGPFTRTGNFINVDPVPLTSELEPDRFDPAPLTSDLEPDRSGYFPLYL